MNKEDKMEAKIDAIARDIGDIKLTQAQDHLILEAHESRSTKLEGIVLPLYKKAIMLEGVLKFLAFLGILAGIYEALSRIK